MKKNLMKAILGACAVVAMLGMTSCSGSEGGSLHLVGEKAPTIVYEDEIVDTIYSAYFEESDAGKTYKVVETRRICSSPLWGIIYADRNDKLYYGTIPYFDIKKYYTEDDNLAQKRFISELESGDNKLNVCVEGADLLNFWSPAHRGQFYQEGVIAQKGNKHFVYTLSGTFIKSYDDFYLSDEEMSYLYAEMRKEKAY